VFNTARIEALEVDNLIECAQATMVSAAARKECRGAHTVNDYERPADDAESRWAQRRQLDEAHPVAQRQATA
jgi:succinate dehydrogenase/fumarate reductase flavoprotein subunit